YLKEGCSEYTGSIDVIFTVRDACGNDVDLPATFKIEDSIAPEIVTPAQDMVVECDSSIPDYWKQDTDYDVTDIDAQLGGAYPGTNYYAWLIWLSNNGGATATDGCSGVRWRASYRVYGDSCDTEYRTTFYAFDQCGNMSKTTASFHVQDTNSPAIGNEAQDLIVECGEEHICDEQRGDCYTQFDHWLHTNGGAKAMDMCDKSLTWTNDWNGKDLTDECGNTGRITVNFTVTDNCGLSSTTAAEYRIVDTIAPTMHIPGDITLELDDKCEADITPANTGMATATDACSDVDVTFTDVEDKQACVTTIIRTWKATDDCGNVTAKDQKITLIDKLAPVYTGNVGQFNMSNVDACEAPAAPAEQSIADQFTDACGHVIATLVDTITISDDTCDWAVQFVYEVADNCGNVYDGTVKVTYWGSDQTAPNLMDGEKLPEGASGINACLADALEANPAVPNHAIEKIFEDNCGISIAASSELTVTERGCKWAFHYTYYVIDDCGNETEFKQEFSGEDNTAPELIGTIPSDMSDLDACIDSYEGPSEQEIAALFHEECGLSVVKTTHRTGSNCDNGWINSFEYTVSDACGNVYPPFKIIYQGSDQSAPEWAYDYKVWTDNSVTGVCPDDAYVSLQVGDVISQFDSYIFNGYTVDFIANPAVTDNCTAQADIKIRVVNITETSDGCSSNIAVDVVAEDSCGNASAVYTKNHVTNDTVAPVIDCPVGEDFEYGEALVMDTTVLASDNCSDEVDVNFEDSVPIQVGSIQVLLSNDFRFYYSQGYYIEFVENGTQNGYPKYDGTFSAALGLYGILAWDNDASAYHLVYYFSADDSLFGTAPGVGTGDLCDMNNWTGFADIINVECEQYGTAYQYSITRTFTATDGCNNSANCDVKYTYYELANGETSDKNTDITLPDYIENNSSAANDSGDATVDFRAYPVPFNGEVTIAYNFNFDTDVTVEVYDTKGMLVLSKEASYLRGTDATMPLAINGSDQMYYIKVITNQGTMTKKVVATSGN
ncbi:T9SS type A sorting domain-containing protein, partial [Flavobacteriaceae bacterium S0862]|nr:T9SS type A sorting domain-containing protein [Flavobacteriaceae bacterium S0862]